MSATSGPATAGPATPTPDPGAPAQTERAGSTARGRVLSIIGVILLPLLIASGFIWATSGSGSRLTRSEAAIVTLDEGSSIGGKPVRLGQTYALELRNQQGPNFTWRYGVAMTEAQRGRVVAALASRLVDGVITIDASEHRSQRQNRQAARTRLADGIRQALAPPPPPRRATKPTKGSQRRRLAAKARRADVKSGRGRVTRADD